MCFQMPPQTVCTRRSIVTLVTFVWFFSTVRFQMCPQTVCPRWCIVTLVAFVWFFSTVRFQMAPQMACLRRCIVTLIAFVWLFSTVRFQMSPQNVCPRIWMVTLVAFIWLNDIVSLFLQGFPFISLETKVIIFKNVFHCVLCSVQVVVSNWVKSMQWLLINNRKCQLFYGTLSLFHNWTANVLWGPNFLKTWKIHFLIMEIFPQGNCPRDRPNLHLLAHIGLQWSVVFLWNRW